MNGGGGGGGAPRVATEAGNRAQRAVVLVGFLEVALWVAVVVALALDSAIGTSASSAPIARLFWWHVLHAPLGAYLLLLVCARSLLAVRALIALGLVALGADTIGIVLAIAQLLAIFPSTSFFVYLYVLFHAAFGALAVALVFYATRLYLAPGDSPDDSDAARVAADDEYAPSSSARSSAADEYVAGTRFAVPASQALRRRA